MNKLKLLVSVALMIFLASPSWADLLSGKDSLKGVKKVSVMVFLPDKDILDTNIIKTDVELKLRMAGINVLEFALPKSAIDNELCYLHVQLQLNKHDGLSTLFKTNSYYGYIELELWQMAALLRNPNIMPLVPTWKNATIATFVYPVENDLRDIVKNLVDTFLNDYLTVNPVQTPIQPRIFKKGDG